MDWRNPHFADPEWLWLAAAAPCAIVLLHAWATRQRRRQLHQLVAPSLASNLTRSLNPRLRLLRHCLLALAAALLGLGLARPQWGERLEQPETLGEDILFLLDCSRSMTATDVAPNRRVRASLAVLDFVERHGQGRVGLVGFAGQAFLLCPLTFDYDAFRDALLAIDDNTIPVPGTNLGRALEEGIQTMEQNSRRHIFVLLTDGEDLEGQGIRTAETLAHTNTVVFTIGVGTLTGSSLPSTNLATPGEAWRDARGQIVHSRLDEETLRSIARMTGGEYHPLGVAGEGLAAVRRVVESTPFGRRFSQTQALGVDRFPFFVAAIVLLLVVESLTPMRRSTRRLTNYTRTAPVTTLCLFFALPALSATNPPPASPPPATTNSIASTNATAATNAPTADPDPALLDARELFNLGSRRLTQGKLRDAESALFLSLSREAEPVQPPALFNLGHVRFLQGHEALSAGPDSQAALDRGRAAFNRAGTGLQQVDSALDSTDLNNVVSAYLQGRGMRRDLLSARTAVRRALENHRAVLLRWQRAAADFRSAQELHPDDDTQFNAEQVERHIARLVDVINTLQMAFQSLSDRQDLMRQRLEQLKGRMPFELQEQMGANGDEEDPDLPDGPQSKEEPQPNTREQEAREGRTLPLTPEEAANLLRTLKLDAQRKLSMGNNENPKPNSRRGRDW